VVHLSYNENHHEWATEVVTAACFFMASAMIIVSISYIVS
jgi:hypothetical protein